MFAGFLFSDKMKKSPTEILRDGRLVLDPVMEKFGFIFAGVLSGKGSGGPYASGTYLNKDRKLQIHFRYSLGLVTYHFGTLSMDHASYMRALLGNVGGNKYPGFADSPLVQFDDLAYDLRTYATAFLNGDFDLFEKYSRVATERNKIPGFSRLAQYES